MPLRKALILFFVLVAVVYGVLLIPWPGVLSGYRAAVAGTCNIFFRRIGDGRITFETMVAPTLDKDTEVVLKNAAGSTGKMNINARRMYLPTAFTVALIVAAPIPWRRKLAALGLGFILISAFLGFGVWLKLLYGLSEPRGLAAVSLGPSIRRFIMVLIKIMTMSPVTPYIAALLVFVLVTVRREDVVRLGSATAKTQRPVSATVA